jgi:hypothetical protein
MLWIDPEMLAELTGYDVRSEYRSAGEAKSLPEPTPSRWRRRPSTP